MSSACECHIEGAWCFYCEMYVPMEEAYEAEKERAEKLFTLVEQQGKEMNRLQDALRRKARNEQKLRESMEHCIEQYPLWDSKEIACIMMVDFMKNVLSILYPKEVSEG